jgi:hypothetical protein
MSEKVFPCIRQERPKKNNKTPVRIVLIRSMLEIRTCSRISYQYLFGLTPGVGEVEEYKGNYCKGETH